MFFLFFPWYFSNYSSFILWSPSCFHSGPSSFITLLHFYVYEFCFTSCSKDPHFDPEGREENKKRLPFSFKNLLIGDLRASNKSLSLLFAVSFLLISHSSDLYFPPPFFLSVYLSNGWRISCPLSVVLPFSKRFLIYCSEDVVWLNCNNQEQAFCLSQLHISQGLEEEIRIISVPFLLWNPSFSSSILMMYLVLVFLRKLFLFHRESFSLEERASHNTWKINREMWDNGSVALLIFIFIFFPSYSTESCLHLAQGKVEESLRVCVYTNMHLWI